jgi:hypothetical protein
MPVTARQLVVAGVLTATAVAVPAAALAGGNNNTPATTRVGQTVSPGPSVKHPSKPPRSSVSLSEVASRLASRLGVSTSTAEHAVTQLQGNVTHSRFAAVAHELGVTPARLNTALREVKMSFAPAGGLSKEAGRGSRSVQSGHSRSLTALPAAAAALASHLGVSISAAQHAMHQLGVLSARQGGVESNSPQFRAIAHGLGVSVAQLNDALRTVKESFAGSAS